MRTESGGRRAESVSKDKLYPFRWPLDPPQKLDSPLGTALPIFKEIFGALSQDESSPFSRISVANSSFSLDPFVGCPARCAYCVVGSSARDLDLTREVEKIVPTHPRRLFSGRELVNALVSHPGFIPNKSVISIGTGSTESFLPDVEGETWEIIRTLSERGLRNPIWIVTKLGIPDNLIGLWTERFEYAVNADIPIVFSVTYSAAPDWMEPYSGDRFRNAAKLRNAGVKLSHHYRPILQGVNSGPVDVSKALQASLGLVDVICIGGLRPDPGIQLIWEKVHGLEHRLLPHGPGKQLPAGFIDLVRQTVRARGFATKVVNRSSEAISFLLDIPEFNLYRLRPEGEDGFLLLSPSMREKISALHQGNSIEGLVERAAESIGLYNITCVGDKDVVRLNRRLLYQEHRLLIHALGHSGVLDGI